ncbi:MAG: hypothetical protein H6636_13900 [Anaerolineales bacterium]|nr:hypothetical protein [Anaerolineales bacterium]
MSNNIQRLDRFSKKIIVILMLLVLGIFATPASAQSYSFSVPELNMQVFVQADGNVRIVYDITFDNSSYGHTIDIVDIGMPTKDYDIANMSASVDGVAATGIYRSEYVNPGVEVHLGSKMIAAGSSGKLHFEFTMPSLIYQDVTKKDYASLQITPTWFGSEYINGTTNLNIAIHMLDGIQPDEVLYQNNNMPFTSKALYQNHVVAVWQFDNTRLDGPHEVGISFPTRGLNNFIKMNILTLPVFWFKNNENARVVAGIFSIILFSILFFRFTNGTGFALWALAGCGLIWSFVQSPGWHLCSFFPLIGLIIVNETALRTKKKKYMPAIAQVEGGGIKRGLTAAEAAAILEMPLNKVLSLVIFGLLKKGILTQLNANPLAVEVAPEFRAKNLTSMGKRQDFRRKAAQDKGTVLHTYEHKFLDAIEARPDRPVSKIDFTDAMKDFLTRTAVRVKGFDLSDTQDYYRKIVDRAWGEAQKIGEIEQKDQFLDKNMEWVLMHDDYPTVFTTPRHIYYPIWTRPIYTGGGMGGAAPKVGGSKSSSSGPGLGDVAGGFAGWAENTMAGLAGAILPGKISAPGTQGVINLSGLDKATGDFFEALSKSSGSGGSGGGGGSCACACAGCACACACAGGGR